MSDDEFAKAVSQPSLQRVADDLALARDLLMHLAADLDALLEARESLGNALARTVFDRMLECVYEAADSSSYHGGGGERKVDAIIAEVRALLGTAPPLTADPPVTR